MRNLIILVIFATFAVVMIEFAAATLRPGPGGGETGMAFQAR
jgi:hypothetical protein